MEFKKIMPEKLGNLTKADFNKKLIIRWVPLTSNELEIVAPYIQGNDLELNVPLGKYLIRIENNTLLVYSESDFIVDDNFNEVLLKVDVIPYSSQPLQLNVPLILLANDIEIIFQYELPPDNTHFYFEVGNQWDLLNDSLS